MTYQHSGFVKGFAVVQVLILTAALLSSAFLPFVAYAGQNNHDDQSEQGDHGHNDGDHNDDGHGDNGHHDGDHDNDHHDGDDHDGDNQGNDNGDPTPVVTGSITVCKIVIDSNNAVIDGSAFSGVTFTIPGTGIPATAFTTPLVLNTKILSASEGNDATCSTYSNLPIASYTYGAEQFSGSSDLFETPMYNDQYTTSVSTIQDFFAFQGGDENADGSIILNPNVKDRTLVVLNKLKAVAPVDVCANIEGNQSVAPEGTHIEGNQCVANETPVDVCSNIEGNQSVAPEGTHVVGNQCVTNEAPVDVCANIEGNQTSAPEGTHIDGVNCVANENGGGGGGGSNEPAPQTQSNTGGNGPVGGNGPIAGSFGGFGGGSVLGASTTNLPELPASCTALLHTYMRIGRKNDTDEVKKLQQFLNDHMGTHLTVSGFFGKDTDGAVRAFQKKYEPQVLTPWGIKESTGYVFKTTQRWVNMVNCSSLNIPMPQL